MKITEGKLLNTNYKFAIILSRFNESIGERLLKGTLNCLKNKNIADENIELFKVPGAFEIPVVAEKLASQKKYNSIICLGAVIKGDTPHFDYISQAVSSGIKEVALKYSIPVIFSVLTTNTVEQAFERSGNGTENKGWHAALTAIEMADLMEKIK